MPVAVLIAETPALDDSGLWLLLTCILVGLIAALWRD